MRSSARGPSSRRRLAQLTQLSGGFVASTLLDKRLGREEEMVDQRSDELLELVTKLVQHLSKLDRR